MAAWANIKISALGVPRLPIREKARADILFGAECGGEYHMEREGCEVKLYPPELQGMLQEGKLKKNSVVCSVTGRKSTFQDVVNGRFMEYEII